GRVARLIRVVHVGQRHAALTVESDPDNLTVYIDGVERGRTPLTIELDPGVVHVRVRHFWLGEWEANVDLTHTRSMRVFIELREDRFHRRRCGQWRRPRTRCSRS